MNRPRIFVASLAFCLLSGWIAAAWSRISAGELGAVRLTLGLLFFAATLLRPKKKDPATEPDPTPRWPAAMAAAGALLALTGLVFVVRQFEWIGVLTLTAACLCWALPARARRDILLAFAILYFVHPLPVRPQLLLQHLSVHGAEWLLHAANVRIWADGFLLRTGHATIGVTEACSGVVSIVTVLFCALGSAVLLRFSPLATATLLALAAAQAVLANTARIAFTAFAAPGMPHEWAENFLHDSLGGFLLLVVVAVQIEAAAWHTRRIRAAQREQAIQRGDVEPPERASILPPAIRTLLDAAPTITLTLLITATLAFLAFKKRPEHRSAMITPVIEALLDTDPPAALRAARSVLASEPDNAALRTLLAQALLLREKPAEALAELIKIGPLDTLDTDQRLLKSRIQLGLGHLDEASAIIDSLTDDEKQHPAIAMIRAEHAALRDDVLATSSNIVRAATWHDNTTRIRALFPYLAAHEQWAAIANSDPSEPHTRLHQALAALTACMKLNRISDAARLTTHAAEKWPDSPLLLGGQYFLATQSPGSRWESLFARNLLKNLRTLPIELVALYGGYAFEMDRPDLGWIAHRYLAQHDPTHPSLDFQPARYLPQWASFRKHALGWPSAGASDLVDLTPLFRLTGALPPFRNLWHAIPLSAELSQGSRPEQRKQHLTRCLAELYRRESSGHLDRQMESIFLNALAMAGRFDEAHRRIDKTTTPTAQNTGESFLQHAILYELEARWQDSYEMLRLYSRKTQAPALVAHLMTINATINLGLAIPAMNAITRIEESFPDTPKGILAKAATLDVFGHKEEALFVLQKTKLPGYVTPLPQLLYDTGRISEARNIAQTLQITLRERPGDARRFLLPRPAELTVTTPPPATNFMDNLRSSAALFPTNTTPLTSPFLRALTDLTAHWIQTGGTGPASECRTWMDSGRDNIERATALHRLAALLLQKGDREEARRALQEAVTQLPDSTVLWRMLVAASAADPAILKEATRRFPTDPDIWLAGLVHAVSNTTSRSEIESTVHNALKARTLPSGTLVSAADFLLRNGIPDLAADVARDTLHRAGSLLSAHALAVRCAIATHDRTWAVSAAMNAVDQTPEPDPFYKLIFAIKKAQNIFDADRINSLEFLQTRSPDTTVWHEELATAYFQKGDVARALTIFREVLDRDLKDIRLQSLLMAAEAARLTGKEADCLAILEKAHSTYPDRRSILNNLVYQLADDPTGLPRARQLLPALLAMGDNQSAVLDTAARVHFNSGQPQLARTFSEKALASLDESSYGATEILINAAEIELTLGNLTQADKLLQKATHDPRSETFKPRITGLRTRLQQTNKNPAP